MGTSQVGQWINNLTGMREMQEMRVRSLGQEHPLEEDMATHSRILAHGQRSLAGYSLWSCSQTQPTDLILSHFQTLF